MDTGIFIGDTLIKSDFSSIRNKPTTLEGYGITDAYTKTDADSRYRVLNTTQWYGNEVEDYHWIDRAREGGGGWAYAPYRILKNDKTSYLLSIGVQGLDNDLNHIFIGATGWLDANNMKIFPNGDVHVHGGLKLTGSNYLDLVSIPREKAALEFNNTGNYRIGINHTDGDGNLRIAKTDGNGDWLDGDINILLGSNNYKVWHAGNDGSGSGLDADLLDGYHLGNVGGSVMHQTGFPHYSEFDSIDNDVYLKKVLGWCYNNVNTGANDSLFVGVGHPNSLGNLQILLYCAEAFNSEGYPQYSSGVFFPIDSMPYIFGTSNYNYYQYRLVSTAGTVFGKPYDSIGSISGGAKFLHICIETDNNGNDAGMSSEINNYDAELNLQWHTSRDITMCYGGGNVIVGAGVNSYKFNVNGDIYASGQVYSNGTAVSSDMRRKNVILSHVIDLDDMVNADLFDYTLIDDESEEVRIGTSANYWSDKLPQVVKEDKQGMLALDYAALSTACSLSLSKYVKLLEDRVTLLENKIASLS